MPKNLTLLKFINSQKSLIIKEDINDKEKKQNNEYNKDHKEDMDKLDDLDKLEDMDKLGNALNKSNIYQRVEIPIKNNKDDLTKEVKSFNGQNYIEDKDFLAKINFTDGYKLYKVISSLNKISDIIIIKIDSTGILIYAINESNTNLLCLNLSTSLSSNSSNSYIFKREQKILLDLKLLLNSLKCKKNDQLSTALKFSSNKIEIIQYSRKENISVFRVIKQIIDENNFKDVLDNLLRIDYKYSVILNQNVYSNIISLVGRFSDDVIIELNPEELILRDDSRENSSLIRLDKRLIKINYPSIENWQKDKAVINRIPLKDLKLIKNILLEKDQSLEIYIENNVPLKILTKFYGLEDSYAIFFIAPNIY